MKVNETALVFAIKIFECNIITAKDEKEKDEARLKFLQEIKEAFS